MEQRFEGITLDILAQAAREILHGAGGEKIFCFFGDMGAGKTTLIQELCKVLDVQDEVVSPTYPIVNEYQCAEGTKVVHMDLYRIGEIDELLDLGFEEYLVSGNYCFIEWPEIGVHLIPCPYIKVEVSRTEGKLNINLTKHD